MHFRAKLARSRHDFDAQRFRQRRLIFSSASVRADQPVAAREILDLHRSQAKGTLVGFV